MKDIKEITLEELVDKIIKAQSVIEEMQAQTQILKDEIAERLRKSKLSGTKVGDYLINRVRRISTANVELPQAREYGAVRETIDPEKIKQLVLKGIKIRGVKWIEYINIREAKHE